jgi:hypothetical protein
VESRVRVLQERQAAKVAAAARDADQQVMTVEAEVAEKHDPDAGAAGAGPAGAGAQPAGAPPAGAGQAGAKDGRGSPRPAGDGDGSSPVPGVTPIGSLTKPGRAVVEGRIRVVEIRPVERNSVLACEISDGTGVLTAMFYGRSHIPGIVCGARVRFRGSVGIRAGGQPVMTNPAYELLFPAV